MLLRYGALEAMTSPARSDYAPPAHSPFWTNRAFLFWAAVSLWLFAMLATWPVGLSFGDEVGYLGQARLFLEGRVRPTPDVPGIWSKTPAGLIPRYPPLLPLLIAPAFAITPRAIFGVAAAAAVALAWIASRVLKSWNRDPLWGLLVLAHPTIIILSRTVMADVLITTFTVAAWWSLKHGRRALTIALLAATVAIKPTGIVIAAALLAGEALSLHLAAHSSVRQLLRRLSPGVVGFALGVILTGTLNLLANGSLSFGYGDRERGLTYFSPKYLADTGVAHLKSLLLCPPLVLIGAWPFWRRRDFGPLLVIAIMILMMSVYFFVDWGRSWLETVILSQRLILPAIGFLLIGYAACLDDLVSRPVLRGFATMALMVVPMVMAIAIGSRHLRWQRPMRVAVTTAAQLSASHGDSELGLTLTALKAGLLHRGRTTMVGAKKVNPPRVVLCGTANDSYRTGDFTWPCKVVGYRVAQSLAGYEILVREEGKSPREASPALARYRAGSVARRG